MIEDKIFKLHFIHIHIYLRFAFGCTLLKLREIVYFLIRPKFWIFWSQFS